MTIGDCIIDAIQVSDAPPTLYPGGAGLNLAVGLARLGLPSALAARVGLDRNGSSLVRYLRDEGVQLIGTVNADFTGVATSQRREGEPSYHFSESMYRRRIGFNAVLRQAMNDAPAVVVNSFPYENSRQTEALCDALSCADGLKLLDPNVRPRLIADLEAFREGFERAATRATLIKLSDEDGNLLYQRENADLAATFFERGIQVVLLTLGRFGASVFVRSGLVVTVPATPLAAPIVDTMGAGDATLASVVAFILNNGMPDSGKVWKACLRQAMDVAAVTCRSAGGALVRSNQVLSLGRF